MLPTHKKLPGQAISEYSLGIALIAIVCLGGLITIGKDLKTNFTNMVPAPAAAAPAVTSASSSGGSIAVTSPPSSLQPTTPTPIPSTATPSAYNTADNYGALITTLGANGSSALLSDKLLAYSKQLLADGQISAQQANLFSDLANEGHRIAAIENLLETAVSSNTPTITFEGTTYPTFEFSQKIGWKGGAGVQPDLLNPLLAVQANPEMAAFTAKYQALVNSGAMSNPGIKELTSKLSGDIANISEALENNVAAVSKGGGSTSSVMQAVASDLTNVKSVLICNTGGGTDVLHNCP